MRKYVVGALFGIMISIMLQSFAIDREQDRIKIVELPEHERVELQFVDKNGKRVGVISGTENQLNIVGFNNVVIGGNVKIDPAATVDFQGSKVDFSDAEVIGLD